MQTLRSAVISSFQTSRTLNRYERETCAQAQYTSWYVRLGGIYESTGFSGMNVYYNIYQSREAVINDYYDTRGARVSPCFSVTPYHFHARTKISFVSCVFFFFYKCTCPLSKVDENYGSDKCSATRLTNTSTCLAILFIRDSEQRPDIEVVIAARSRAPRRVGLSRPSTGGVGVVIL